MTRKVWKENAHSLRIENSIMQSYRMKINKKTFVTVDYYIGEKYIEYHAYLAYQSTVENKWKKTPIIA